MPQTKAEKKFSQIRVSKTNYNFAPLTIENPTLAKFQGFKQNQNGGAA